MKKLTIALICILVATSFSGCTVINSIMNASSEVSTVQPSSTVESTVAPKSESSAESRPESSAESQIPATTAKPSATPSAFDAKLNYAALTADAKAFIGDHIKEYQSFVAAVVKGEESFEFSDKSAKKAVFSAISCFPLYILCNPFTMENEETLVPIVYKNGVAQFRQSVETFENNLLPLLARVQQGTTPSEKALFAYEAVAKLSYNSSGYGDCYSLISGESGSAFGFSATLSFILSQFDVKNVLASGLTSSGKEHRWVVATFEGGSFNMDPTYENGATGGTGLGYFAISDSAIEKAGTSLPYATGESSYFKQGQRLCKDESLDRAFKKSTIWELDSSQHILYIGNDDTTGFTSTVSTDELKIIN